jgi:hypothetical protein
VKRLRRRVAFLVVTAITAVSLLAAAQPRRGGPAAKPPVTAPGKRPPAKPPASSDVDASAPMAGREEKTQPSPSV